MSAEEGFPPTVAKEFSGLKEKDCDESLSNEVNISFNFALIFLEKVLMMSLTKEEVVISSAKTVTPV